MGALNTLCSCPEEGFYAKILVLCNKRDLTVCDLNDYTYQELCYCNIERFRVTGRNYSYVYEMYAFESFGSIRRFNSLCITDNRCRKQFVH